MSIEASGQPAELHYAKEVTGLGPASNLERKDTRLMIELAPLEHLDGWNGRLHLGSDIMQGQMDSALCQIPTDIMQVVEGHGYCSVALRTLGPCEQDHARFAMSWIQYVMGTAVANASSVRARHTLAPQRGCKAATRD